MPCMCGGCPRCLRDQGYKPCPKCGAYMGCDCAEDPPCLVCGAPESQHDPGCACLDEPEGDDVRVAEDPSNVIGRELFGEEDLEPERDDNLEPEGEPEPIGLPPEGEPEPVGHPEED